MANSNIIREHSGTKLIEKRLAAGLTVNQLAAKARVSPLTLRNWERSSTKPQVYKARLVRDALQEAAPPEPDVIDRDALAGDVEVLRQGMGVLYRLLPNLVEALAHVAKHVDDEARDILANEAQADD
jgi:transcriptional regulator with XRE-family HTH domain